MLHEWLIGGLPAGREAREGGKAHPCVSPLAVQFVEHYTPFLAHCNNKSNRFTNQ